MIVIELTGNIGNQMFQYAAARNFALLNNCPLLVDSTWFVKNKKQRKKPNKIALNGFNVSYKLAGSSVINNFLKKNLTFFIRYPEAKYYSVVKEAKKQLSHDLYLVNPPFFMKGNYNSEVFFKDNIAQIRQDFTIKDEALEEIVAMPLALDLQKANTVTMYVYNNFSGFLTGNGDITINIKYYKSAIEWIENTIAEPHFVVFTNLKDADIDNLGIKNTKTVVHLSEDELEWKHVFLMSRSQYFIADNSNTSWWAAWLNFSNTRTVIVPQIFGFDKPVITHETFGIEQTWITL